MAFTTIKRIPVKSLRLTRHWSQEQLAQLSNLNVRTIQRVEKGEGAGLETLKSLASVFEISMDELKAVIERDNQPRSEDVFNSENSKAMHERAKAKVDSGCAMVVATSAAMGMRSPKFPDRLHGSSSASPSSSPTS